MTLGYNSQVLSPRQWTVNVKIQFDCTHMYDLVDNYILCSDPTIQIVSIDKVNNWFDISINVDNVVEFSAVMCTPLMLNPPVQGGVPVSPSAGSRNMFVAFLNNGLVRIGALRTTVPATHKIPDVVFFEVVAQGYNSVEGV